MKMNFYGIRKLLPWLEDFITTRSQIVVVDGIKSRLVKVQSGIPQGTVIAALCFLIFINDLPDVIAHSFSGIFCDDTLLAKEVTNQNDSNMLQNDLDQVAEWSTTWGMKFNVDKFVVMTVTNRQQPFINNYLLNSEILKRKKIIKYLGIFIDNKLTFNHHVDEKQKSAMTILNMIWRKLHFKQHFL